MDAALPDEQRTRFYGDAAPGTQPLPVGRWRAVGFAGFSRHFDLTRRAAPPDAVCFCAGAPEMRGPMLRLPVMCNRPGEASLKASKQESSFFEKKEAKKLFPGAAAPPEAATERPEAGSTRMYPATINNGIKVFLLLFFQKKKILSFFLMPPPTRAVAVVFLLAVLLPGVPAAARAEEAAVPAPPSAGDLLNTYNRIIFAINHEVYSWVDWLSGNTPLPETVLPAPDLAPPPVSPPSPGPARMVANLINEPLTAMSSVLVGDLPTAWNAVQRFGINSTVGVLGWWDEASAEGLKPVAADVGLALCRLGVGEGGYVILPFVGPRTWRDGFADVVLVNALLWTATGAIFSSGLSVQTIIIAETIEVAADIVATRQIDPRAKELRFDDYEKMRADYLAQRRLRCASSSAMEVAAAGNIP